MSHRSIRWTLLASLTLSTLALAGTPRQEARQELREGRQGARQDKQEGRQNAREDRQTGRQNARQALGR
ncbi:hypothetical protein [Stigmatella aurantiaca]|nr:hypothetical protein [Stigmatella aurantiaca]ADO68444.1 uncharacterized protein STAUR_0640 [Stigmatella aurantiaca DW4/3-1]